MVVERPGQLVDDMTERVPRASRVRGRAHGSERRPHNRWRHGDRYRCAQGFNPTSLHGLLPARWLVLEEGDGRRRGVGQAIQGGTVDQARPRSRAGHYYGEP